MGWGLKIYGVFLDTYPDSSITIQYNSELWTTGDPTLQTGSYSFPVKLPLTPYNRRMLRMPERIDSFTTFDIVKDAVIYAGPGSSTGLPLFTGSLYIKSSTPEYAEVFIVVEGLAAKKELTFAEVDMGVFNLSVPIDLEAVINHTTTDPLDQPFVFFPVWNETLYSTYTGTPYIDKFHNNAYGAKHINLWVNTRFAVFPETDPDKKINSQLVPFMRLEYVLERIAQKLGYTIINEWMDDEEEFQYICIFNNKSINDLDTVYKYKIRYNEHLPSGMSITTFLKEVCKWHFIGTFVDNTSKTILLRPYRRLIKHAHRHVWTDRQTVDMELTQDNEVPSLIGYDSDGSDTYFNNNFVTTVPLLADGAVIDEYWEAGGNPTLHGLIDGYYHVNRDNTIMRYDPSKTNLYEKWTKFSHRFKSIFTGARGPKWLSRVIPMWSDSGWNSFAAYTYPWSLPRVDMAMNIKLKFDDEIIESNAELTSIRLAIYRGMRDFQGGAPGAYPYANATAYDPATEDDTFDHSLHYDGEKGIYNQYGKQWVEFMKKKKTVKMKLKLSIIDLLNFKEYDKIRIGNMNYFMKSYSVTISQTGMSLTDAELVSISTS